MERYSEKKAWEEAQKLQAKVKEGTTGYAYAERLAEEEKIPHWAKSYVDMPKERLEEGIKKILEEIENSSARETPQGLFTEAMLNLEMYYDLQDVSVRKAEAEKYLTKAEDDLTGVVNKNEDFEIKYRSQDKEKTFGNLSLANAFLGDIFIRKYLKDNIQEDWFGGYELYEKAVKQEKDLGRADELKTIQAARKIIWYLGDEKAIRLWKTTRRKDLRGEAADLTIRYQKEKKSADQEQYVDTTRNLSEEKLRKQKASPTKVSKVSDEMLEKILNENLERPFATEDEFKKRPRVVLQKIKGTMAARNYRSIKLETAVNIKESEKLKLMESFGLNPDKIKNIMPFMDVKKLQSINWFEL